MNLNELTDRLQKLYSKESVANIAGKIKTKQDTKLLISLLNNPDHKLANRAAWVLSHSYDLGNKNIIFFNDSLIEILLNSKLDSVKRNILRCFQEEVIPEKYESAFFDFCTKSILNPNEKVAAKVFSVSCLFQLVKKYPELKDEFKLVCHEILPTASAGLKNRILKVLKKLN